MTEEISLLEWVFRGVTAAISVVGGYLFVKINENSDDIVKTNAAIDLVKLEQANYKLDVEKRYADKESIQSTMARIYKVLEDHRRESLENTSEIRADIKTIMNSMNKYE